MGSGLIARLQIKNYVKIGDKALSISNDFYEALNKEVQKLIEEACDRAVANFLKILSSLSYLSFFLTALFFFLSAFLL